MRITRRYAVPTSPIAQTSLAWAVKNLLLQELFDCAPFLPFRLTELNRKPISMQFCSIRGICTIHSSERRLVGPEPNDPLGKPAGFTQRGMLYRYERVHDGSQGFQLSIG